MCESYFRRSLCITSSSSFSSSPKGGGRTLGHQLLQKAHCNAARQQAKAFICLLLVLRFAGAAVALLFPAHFPHLSHLSPSTTPPSPPINATIQRKSCETKHLIAGAESSVSALLLLPSSRRNNSVKRRRRTIKANWKLINLKKRQKKERRKKTSQTRCRTPKTHQRTISRRKV